MKNKQTAVEWLVDWMDKNQYFIGNDLIQAVEQAKQMEKNQMFDYAPYDIVVFAKTDKGAIGKAKRKFPSYELISASFIRHCL